MQLSPTDRVRWTWLLVLVTLVIAAALWWKPSHEERVVLAPAASRPIPIAVHEPLPPPAPAPLPVAAPAPPLQLVGTVAAGGGSFAMVRHTTDSQLLQLRVGDQVDGFAVTAIEPDRVVLAGATQPVVLQAEKAAPAAVAPEPAIAASATAAKAPGTYAEGQAPWDLVPPFQH